jgi:diphthine-ammonia ligase
MSEKYLGKDITIDLVTELSSAGIDAAGENGEYHTFVYDGPIFNGRIEFSKKGIIKKDNYLFLEIE